MSNLHDYIGKNRKWEQLWADDQEAIWFERTDSKQYPYEVFRARPNMLFDDGVMIISQAFCENITQAFEIWNGCINKHLEATK